MRARNGALPRVAAMLQSNPPTAYAMLRYTIPQPEGGWVIQNLSNSGVGIAVIQVAKRLGMRTVNIVRREGLAEQLTALGADRVLVSLCRDLPGPHTALTALALHRSSTTATTW